MTSAEKKRMLKTKWRLLHESNRKYKRKWGMPKLFVSRLKEIDGLSSKRNEIKTHE